MRKVIDILRLSAADILLCSTYIYFPDATPDHPGVRAWVERCSARLAYQRALADD